MISLILLGIIGLAMAYFATQNTGGVPITIANYTYSGIPLYLLVIGSVMLGIAVSWLISLVDSITAMFTIHGKDTAISQAHKTIELLKKENHDLALENARLKGEHKKESHHTTDDTARPSLLHRLRHNVS